MFLASFKGIEISSLCAPGTTHARAVHVHVHAPGVTVYRATLHKRRLQTITARYGRVPARARAGWPRWIFFFAMYYATDAIVAIFYAAGAVVVRDRITGSCGLTLGLRGSYWDQ